MNHALPMTITEHHIPEALILTLEGSLDLSSKPKFMKAIHRAIQDNHSHVMVNVEHIIFTDSGAIGMLVMAYHKLTLHHRRFSLFSPSPSLTSQLEAVNFPRIIPIYESLEAALTRKVFPFSMV